MPPTATAGSPIGRAHQRIGRLIEIGVGHHHHVVLGAAQGLHPLSTGSSGRIDVFGDRSRADKADCRDPGMVQDRIDRGLVAVDDIKDTGRQPGLGQQFSNPQPGRRVALRRLQNKGVAASQCHREHPHRHHRREVERRDPGAYPQRLAHRPAVDAAPDLLGEFPLQQMRDAAGELDDLDTAGDLALGVGKDFAVLFGNQLRQCIVLARQEFEEFEHDARAGEGRGRGPAGKRPRPSLYRLIDLTRFGKRNTPDLLPGRRIEDIAAAAAFALDPFSTDVMLDVAHHRSPAAVTACGIISPRSALRSGFPEDLNWLGQTGAWLARRRFGGPTYAGRSRSIIWDPSRSTTRVAVRAGLG
jgi:hypothetical protein